MNKIIRVFSLVDVKQPIGKRNNHSDNYKGGHVVLLCNEAFPARHKISCSVALKIVVSDRKQFESADLT